MTFARVAFGVGLLTLAGLAHACSAHSTPDATPAQPALPPPPQAVPFISLGSTPPVGTPDEYDAMMEQVRARFSLPNEPLEMTMASFHRVGDWARVVAQSHAPGRRDDSEQMNTYSSLFRKVDGAWQWVQTDCAEDSDACNESHTLAGFMKRHPEAPRELASAPPPAKAKPTIYGRFGETSLEIAFEDLPRLVPLAKGETFKIAELARDATSSYHVVAMLGAEPLHKHAAHDLIVVQIEGQGEMLIGQTTRPIGPHSIVHVPRGITHSMRNTEKTPLIGYAIFTPPFDGKDRVLLDP